MSDLEQTAIARVFPRKTNASPTDALAFFSEPTIENISDCIKAGVTKVHISVTFTWDFERAGYHVVVFNFEAAAVGAWHRRSRVFFTGIADISDADCERQQRREQSGTPNAAKDAGEQPPCATTGKCRETADNAVCGGCDGVARREQSQEFAYGRCWAAEPDVDRVAHGIPHRVDRIKCLGNAVVPQQAYPIFKALREKVFR